jgi:hypothetical protein
MLCHIAISVLISELSVNIANINAITKINAIPIPMTLKKGLSRLIIDLLNKSFIHNTK